MYLLCPQIFLADVKIWYLGVSNKKLLGILYFCLYWYIVTSALYIAQNEFCKMSEKGLSCKYIHNIKYSIIEAVDFYMKHFLMYIFNVIQEK